MTNHFLILLCQMIFEEDPPCMSREAMDVVTKLAEQFASPDGTYLRVFGYQNSSPLLLKYATDILVRWEILYHLSIGLLVVFQRKKKAPWHTLPFPVGSYESMILKGSETEGNELENFRFKLMEYHSYDPRVFAINTFLRYISIGQGRPILDQRRKILKTIIMPLGPAH